MRGIISHQMSKRRQTLEFTDGDIGVLRRSNPEEELSHGAWHVGGHHDEDKEKADRFVKIFGKMNGSNFRPARMAKRRQGFIASSFICC